MWSQSAIDRGLGLRPRQHVPQRDHQPGHRRGVVRAAARARRRRRAAARLGELLEARRGRLVAVGARVEPGDAIIGKVVVTQDPETDAAKRDRSKIRANASGVVDRAMLTTNANGKPSVVVRIAQTRFPRWGTNSLRGTVKKVPSASYCPRRICPSRADGHVPRRDRTRTQASHRPSPAPHCRPRHAFPLPQALPSRTTIGHHGVPAGVRRARSQEAPRRHALHGPRRGDDRRRARGGGLRAPRSRAALPASRGAYGVEGLCVPSTTSSCATWWATRCTAARAARPPS